MKVVGVNGRVFKEDLLADAIKAAKDSAEGFCSETDRQQEVA